MKFANIKIFIALALVLISTATEAAYVPVRVSIKFIVDSSGNRPTTGRLNTDDEITAEFNEGVAILRENMSEFTLVNIEGGIVDLTGVSQWYTTTVASPNGGTNRDALRDAAIADPATYLWRDDAINIYINAGTSSAISDFPPTNNIILMNQGCINTPSCILHELGHSLHLYHTHETAGSDGGDECSDTITDNQSWSKDQVANNNYGCLYANCTIAQKAAVDLVYNDIMSYHADEPQRKISTCQKDRISTQGDSDRAWLLATQPVYVRSTYVGSPFFLEFGRYDFPYNTVQEAVASGLTNKVMVVEGATYTPTAPFTINVNSEVVTRSSSSVISPPGLELYPLPTELEKSKNPKVRAAAKSVQDEDKFERTAEKQLKRDMKVAKTDEEMAVLKAAGEKKKRGHKDNAIKNLTDAEQAAEGDEKLALQMELAQRYKHDGNYEQALKYYSLAAEASPDEKFRNHILMFVKEMQQKLMEETQNRPEQSPVDMNQDQK